MKHTTIALIVSSVLFAAASCAGSHSGSQAGNGREMTVDEILEEMRTDTSWIHTLDSLAQTAIGPGARCLDAVKHTFSWDGRLWVYNQDWGGVLEIPEGFVPFDDRWQAEVSYHGAGIQSPDTFVYISHYEAFQSVSYDEFRQWTKETFDTDTLMTRVVMKEETFRFGSGHESPMLVFETLNVDGIKGYFKYIYSSQESVEYAVSIQYPEDSESRYGYIRSMIDRYPLGPNGEDPRMYE